MNSILHLEVTVVDLYLEGNFNSFISNIDLNTSYPDE